MALLNRKKSKMAAKIIICTKWPVIWLIYRDREKIIIPFLKKLYLKDPAVLNYINHNKINSGLA